MLTSGSRNYLLPLLCAFCGCWAFGFGLEFPLAARLLQDLHYSDTFIGANSAVHFLGILIAGVFVPQLMRRSIHLSIGIGLFLSGIALALFPSTDSPALWFALRFLGGAGGAMAMIALESAINFTATSQHRARNFACYACSVGLGFAIGSFSGLQLYGYSPSIAFALGGGVTALPLLALRWLPHFSIPGESESAAKIPLKPPFLSLASAWSQGFLEAGMIALLPIYLRSLNQSDESIGGLLGGILVGVLVFQLPIGWLADRWGRERTLISCYVIVAAGLAIIPFAQPGEGLTFLLCIVGICSGAFYPLGLAILGDRLPDSAIPRANAWYLGVNSFGSLVSPVVLGLAMQYLGRPAMFWICESVILAILVACVFRSTVEPCKSGANADPSGDCYEVVTTGE